MNAKRALIVDDDSAARDLAIRMLTADGSMWNTLKMEKRASKRLARALI